MQKLFFGNIKMNQTPSETQNYLKILIDKTKTAKSKIGIAFPYTNLNIANELCKNSNILVGAQNVSAEDSGSFTGEISSKMLAESGVKFCIVGHSERRKLFGENNAIINKKIKRLMQVNIISVVCVGETKIERDANKTKVVLKKQIEECLQGLFENELKNIVIAYEPVWAIGTGETPTTKQVELALQHITQIVHSSFSTTVNPSLIYGGSINESNIKFFISAKACSGVLVGGSSLDPIKFAKISSI
ncbi:MAG: triose-phosphate isomerase [Clostridia bacterium]